MNAGGITINCLKRRGVIGPGKLGIGVRDRFFQFDRQFKNKGATLSLDSFAFNPDAATVHFHKTRFSIGCRR